MRTSPAPQDKPPTTKQQANGGKIAQKTQKKKYAACDKISQLHWRGAYWCPAGQRGSRHHNAIASCQSLSLYYLGDLVTSGLLPVLSIARVSLSAPLRLPPGPPIRATYPPHSLFFFSLPPPSIHPSPCFASLSLHFLCAYRY